MDPANFNLFIWAGIFFCITQSAMFSGLNLAFFSVGRLRLEVQAANGNEEAIKVLGMRKDSNFLLTTILWGNVGTNVLLALLSKSVMTGVVAFLFSTILITFIGEIFPQAYFSRHALRMASLLSPLLKFYQIVLYPVAKPAAIILDWLLGEEGLHYFKEQDLMQIIKRHVEADEAHEIDRIEGIGALNFLAMDDLRVSQEGEPVDPRSIIHLRAENGLPVFPKFERSPSDPFLQQIQASEKKWVIITDTNGKPYVVLDSDGFLRDALFGPLPFRPMKHCHRPVLVSDENTLLGEVINLLKLEPGYVGDDVIDDDIILVWGNIKKIITGSDILGRLLRGIVAQAQK